MVVAVGSRRVPVPSGQARVPAGCWRCWLLVSTLLGIPDEFRIEFGIQFPIPGILEFSHSFYDMGRGKKRNMLSSKSAKRIIFRNSQVMSSPQIDEGSLEVSGIEIMNDQITAKSSSSRKRQIDGITCSANENIIQIDDASSCEQFKEISSSSSSENDTNDRTNVTGCYQIDDRVHLVVQRWGNVSAIAPDLFLLKLLEARGFETRRISAMDSSYRRYVNVKYVIH